MTVNGTVINGVIVLDSPSQLPEGTRVQVIAQPKTSWVEETAGIARWTGDVEQLRRLALAPEFDLEDDA
jgi:hypothetical protein